jgi:hypothetical protein
MVNVLRNALSTASDRFHQFFNSVRMDPHVTARRLHVATRVEDIKQKDVTRYPGSCVEDLRKMSEAIQSIHDGLHPPLIVLHGGTGSGKSVLAAEMVRRGKDFWYLDAVDVIGNYRTKRAELRTGLVRGAKVFILDEAVYLRGGLNLRIFYLRCKVDGIVLVLVVQDPRDVGSLNFDVPPGAIYVTPDRTWMQKR